MNKIWIIIQREFAVKVKKKSFIILTILMPVLMAAIVFVPALLSRMSGDEKSRVAVIDRTGSLDTLFRSTDKVTFVPLKAQDPVERQITACIQADDPGYDATVLVRGGLRDQDPVVIYSTSEVPHEVESTVNDLLTKALRNEKLSAYRITDIDRLMQDANTEFKAQTIRLDEKGNATMSSSEIAGVVGLVLALIIYMFILSYGGMVMQSVMEEKTNRIVEIMVSSVKPYQLMAGKIIGVALVGLFQFLIWALMLTSLLAVAGSLFGLSGAGAAPAATALSGLPADAVQDVPGTALVQILQGMPLAEMFILFILFFIGGYLLFASLFAAIGASVNEQQDSQQFMMPIIIIFIFGLYAGMFSIQNPDGPLAMWCSFIPLTSPIVMMVRIPFSLPLWQVALSLLILYGTAFLIILLSARIYRVGILMYGRKPTFRDMMKWVRFK